MIGKQGSYTVVTGASSGIGYETAKAFAARGRNLIVTARRRERLETLRQEILAEGRDIDIVVKTADLSRPEEAYRLYRELREYPLETWINSAGIGNYGTAAEQNLQKIETMLRLNVTALTLLSSLFVRDYKDVPGTQLINVSSCGGYIIVPDAVTYCAAKFYVSSFTEGLDRELRDIGANMRAKVFAPAATKTEFGKVANNVGEYDYDQLFGTYHTSRQAAAYLLELYDSDCAVGLVDRETFSFQLMGPKFPYAGDSQHNQRLVK